MNRELVIVGAGGLGREASEYAADAIAAGWPYRLVGFADDSAMQAGGRIMGLDHLGRTDDPEVIAGKSCLIAVGDPESRKLLGARIQALGGTLATLSHPSAFVSPTSQVAPGVIICPFAFIGSNAHVGVNVLVNIYASIGHDAGVGSHSVLSPYATLNGYAYAGDCVFLGTRAILAPKVVLGSFSRVTAGSTVTRTAPTGSLLDGSPATGRVLFRST